MTIEPPDEQSSASSTESAAGMSTDREALRRIIRDVQSGRCSETEALDALRWLPFERLDETVCLDHHRADRCGFPEVVYGEGKTPEQAARLMARLAQRSDRVLATRVGPAHHAAARAVLPEVRYHASSRTLWLDRAPDAPRHAGVLMLAAGTCDEAVIEEAAITADLMHHRPQRIYDVGVAGLHRLLAHRDALERANVIVVAAGMDAALLSVVVGLVRAPVIALPTSVGYGASFNGIAALLSVLNACAPGSATVNIDNGFGAGYLAAMINQRIVEKETGET